METSNSKYKDLSKEQLIQHIEEMKEVINNMKKEKNELELLKLPWVGNLGNWNWLVKSNEMIFNEKKATNLGYEIEEIPKDIGYEFFTTKLHPDDYDKVMVNMRNHLMNLSDAFESEYRIRKKNGDYIWYYDRGKVTKRDENGEAIVVSGIVFDISENKAIEKELIETNKRLEKLVINDDLTCAFNRRYMHEKLNNEIQRYNRTNTVFSIIMIDVDNFKYINDNYGHNLGDKVLKKMAEVINKRIRKTDVLSRLGGDEFMILLPDTKLSKAVILAEDILKQLNSAGVDEIETIKASIGVSEYDDCRTIDDTIKKVDDLMYLAKFDGRNCVRF